MACWSADGRIHLARSGPADEADGPQAGHVADSMGVLMMTDVACHCGCLFSFDSAAGACPRCGEYATVKNAAGPTSNGLSRQRCQRPPAHSAIENEEPADGAETTLPLALTVCPECELPAEVKDRFVLPSTEGPVDHVALQCVARHHFRMPSAMLADVAAGLAADAPAERE